MTVLIFGFPLDVHIHAVRWMLRKVGVRSEVVYTSDLPQVLRASIRIGGGASHARFRHDGADTFAGPAESVWFRRSGLPMQPPGMTDADWTIAQRECDHHIRSLRHVLGPEAFWVNDIEARERALLKALQLQAAEAVGFAVPETLFGNDPDDIRRFFQEFRDSGVIFKLTHQAHWQGASQGERFSLFTSELTEAQLRDDRALWACPAFYQRKIAKAYELRVTCMDEACFAARLDSQQSSSTRVDWRADFSRPMQPHPVALPPSVQARCIALMKKLGLAFGCIDLIVTPEGEHVFLEVNEMGQFLWVEAREPSFPLLRAFATLLVEKRLAPDSRLVGDQTLGFTAFLDSGTWDSGRLEDTARHAPYHAPGLAVEA